MVPVPPAFDSATRDAASSDGGERGVRDGVAFLIASRIITNPAILAARHGAFNHEQSALRSVDARQSLDSAW